MQPNKTQKEKLTAQPGCMNCLRMLTVPTMHGGKYDSSQNISS